MAEQSLRDEVPAAVRAHLEASRILVAAQHDEVRREVGHLLRVMAPLGLPLILLKGSAYVQSGLPAYLGRSLSDVDILVPRSRLSEVESALMLAGWATTHHSEYDQRYYRQWMHELPPMRHLRRGTVLDVHHAILPDTARLKPDAAKLLASARPTRQDPRVCVLAPADMVLHAMTHLFHNEEFSHGLRDLSDIDLLLRHFAAEPTFWNELVERARELDLARPLHYGLRYAHSILGTPVPAAVLDAAARAAPGWPLCVVMDALWRHALRSPHASAADKWTPAARFALYVRAHWLRMPPALLLRHLTIKALRRGRDETAPA